MLHRAILGSLERFIGMLIEHYAGRFPLWLAPVQAVVATITNEADDYARRGGGAAADRPVSGRRPTRGTRRSATRCASTACQGAADAGGRPREAEERTVAFVGWAVRIRKFLRLTPLSIHYGEAGSPLGNLVPESPF